VRKGAIIRTKNGGDWAMWRVEETYEADSPYVLGVLVTTSKYNTAGMVKRLLPKEDYKVEPNPHEWALGKYKTSQVVLDVPCHPNARP
jgi:hypothetical protein